MTAAYYELLLPRESAWPVLAHVPHASTNIPPKFRASMLIDDAVLRREIVRLTDWEVDKLFGWVTERGGVVFASKLSRLVFDPERFPDDAQEPMAAVGMGVVYTRTTTGEPLAHITPEEQDRRLAELYHPYHQALTEAVSCLLEQFGRVTILDCHSFPTEPLPTEMDHSGERPDICIGTDEFHSPTALAHELESRLTKAGFAVRRNFPYSGALVPQAFLNRDSRVTSVMIEVRRALYCDETTGKRSADFDSVRERIEQAVAGAISATTKG